MEPTVNRVVLFILLCLFWLLLSWPDGGFSASHVTDLGAGAAAALLVAWAVGEPAANGARWLQPQRYLWGAAYLLVLAGAIVRANLDVAGRVLHPAMPIRPGIVRIRTRLRSPAARTLLGNSVTLCPGTLTIGMHEDGTMLVHCIHVPDERGEEAGERIIGRFERYIEKILD